MPPRRTTNQRRDAEEDELDRRIEQIIDNWLEVALERRLDVSVDRPVERMGALMEPRQEVDPKRGRVPNPTTDLDDVKRPSDLRMRPTPMDYFAELEVQEATVAMDVDDVDPLEIFGEGVLPVDNRLADSDFFNSFEDDFDDSDIN
ncbi:hypothetical protein CDL15_Pgr009280 [Punica granatum]|uniref:Uncharacterized protein n=3 Tax=Punica granatum TaxID=22663 RepID=A0A218WQ34_PUNGR|nr:hypothetical protein CDL15_Pgr009280 [Punica granatum]